jgi:protein-L-isoaspartate(D-aspartate) O-methyltransferase
MEDSYRHKGLRRKLIAELRERGIQDEHVLEVMSMLPRHYFLDKAFEEWAYQDKAFPIGKEQTISQPFTVAYQTSLLSLKKEDKVLEIGTGSGYQAAVLALLGAQVYTVERHQALSEKANQLLQSLEIPNVHTFYHDGTMGLAAHAPFDKILVTAGADEIPLTLIAQLKIGGILVVPIGEGGIQQMYKIKRISELEWIEERLADFRFVPFLKGKV